MKKLLSLLLAVIMIFSCCTAAANALYLETVTEKEYTDNVLETVKTTEHSKITYDSLNLKGLIGQDFIDALTKVDVTVVNGEEQRIYTDSIGRPITSKGEFVLEPALDESGKVKVDKDGNVVYNQLHPYEYLNYTYTEKTTSQKEVLGLTVDFLYNNRGPIFWDNITANPNLKTVLDEIKKDANNKRYAKALEGVATLEIMLGIDGEAAEDEPEQLRTFRRLVKEIKESLNNKETTNVTENANTIRSTLDIKSSDITLLFGNVNMFLLRMMKSRYSDFRFYTQKNAVSCINFIGNLFYYDFNEVDENIKLFTNNDYIYRKDGEDYVDEDIFFQQVAQYSGLIDLIQTNWVEYGDARANYRPLLLLIGVTEDYLLDSEYYRGDKIAPAILKAAFTRIMGEGPLAYFTSLLDSLSRAYLINYYDAIKLLFKQKETLISDDELRTIDGLLNLIFNNNDKNELNKIQFAPLPQDRLTMAENKSEFYLTLLIYFNINANYRNNREVINNFLQNKVVNNGNINGENTKDEEGNIVYSDKSRLVSIINGICGEDIESVFTDPVLLGLMMENIVGKPAEITNNISEAIARIIKKIADWFQMWIDIFTGKLEFGAGAFD